jgi:adenine-specific DNA-methyltransferase
MKNIAPRKALNPGFRKHKPNRSEVSTFIKNLQECIDKVKLSDSNNESEEHIKSHFKDFFTNTFYKDNYINTKGRIDLAIYLDNTPNSDIGVIIEAKKPSNKSEFLSVNNLNKKALQELLLYYLRERLDGKNNNIKHLIATNGYEWFLFKAEDFYNLFFKNKKLIKEYEEFRDGLKDTSKNELFYDEIAKKYINEIVNDIPFVHIDFSNINLNALDDNSLNTFYKIFSNVHLLGHSFTNDSNHLNKNFYNELLHIIGLEEVSDGGKKVIQRKQESNRDYASLLENTIFTLEENDHLHKVRSIENTPDKPFNVGLELCLTWINRILFLKLLESQLATYHQGAKEYKFLNSSFINGFDELNNLFFSALAKNINERHPRYAEKFKYIPYLNSSLFERNDLETETFEISALNDDEIEVYTNTVLTDNGKKFKGKLKTLDYLFKFLDAYDFATDGTEGITENQESKTLINASVLGLIFEKINGYKDGSFYTPAYITMYMCKETIRKAVVQKFNESENDTIQNFDDVKAYCHRFFKKEDIQRLNNIINSIRICDPAVGSGHFLVSALNELIVIKNELGILVDDQGLALKIDVQIDNDELYITDTNGYLFKYIPTDTESTRIQKTLFKEKQTLIENCLFGVDINPNSVKICRLRLWIELLKNAYYNTNKQLETLPNIDINIKCGNSLISRFDLNDDLKAAFKNKEVKYNFTDYKKAVADYKKTNSKEQKREVLDIINHVKNNFKSTLDDDLKQKVQKAIGKYENEKQRLNNLEQFGEKLKKAELDNLKKLKVTADIEAQKKEDILNNVIYKNAFEWRFEFPEVLDDKGTYLGFDVVIGNPPYIRLQGISDFTKYYNNEFKTATRKYDIYVLFVEKSVDLLKINGINCFILPHKFLISDFGIGLRSFLLNNQSIEGLIHFGSHLVFEDASTYTCILTNSKKNNSKLLYSEIKPSELLYNVYYNEIPLSKLNDETWQLKDTKVLNLLYKIDSGIYLKDISKGIYQGLISMGDDIYVLKGKIVDNLFFGYSQKLKKEVILESDIMKPLLKGKNIQRYKSLESDIFIIYPHKKDKNNKTVPLENTEFQSNFPLAFSYLENFKNELIEKKNKYKTNTNFWYALHRSREINIFENQYIITPQLQNKPSFSINENIFYADAGGYMITELYNYNSNLLLAILNSKVMWFFIKNTSSEYSGGYYYFKTAYLEPFPLPKEISSETQKLLIKKVKEIYFLNVNNDSVKSQLIEKEIDNIVYQLYNLTDEEIAIVENS